MATLIFLDMDVQLVSFFTLLSNDWEAIDTCCYLYIYTVKPV
jgi:hypothetical protein